MGNLYFQTLYADAKHYPLIVDALHTIEPDGTEVLFDCRKIIPMPPEAEMSVHICDDHDALTCQVGRGFAHKRAAWAFEHWGTYHLPFDCKYICNRNVSSDHFGQLGLQYVTKNGNPWWVILALSRRFPDAIITVSTDHEAGDEINYEIETFKAGVCISHITVVNDWEEWERKMKGAPLDEEELKRFPVDPAE
jgi:hypothetical protein